MYTAGQADKAFSGVLGGAWASLYGPNTGSDGYLVKQDLDGTVQWQIVIGAAGNDGITGVCTDMLGQVYVTGFFSGTNASFTGFTGSSQTMSSTGAEDIFVACYTANGELQWKTKAGGAGNDRGNGICYANGQLFVGGSYVGSPLLAGFGTPTTSVGAVNIAHSFVLALQASNGTGLWLATGSNVENSAINAVATDGSQVFALGVHKGTPYSFGTSTGPVTVALTTIGNNISADVAAISSAGTINWAQAVSNPVGDEMNALGLATSATAVYISGNSHNNSVFPGPVVIGGTGNPHDYGYLARLNKSSGQTAWVRTFSGAALHVQTGRALATDSHGDVLWAGCYRPPVTLPGGRVLNGNNDLEVFLAKVNSSGVLKWPVTPIGEGDDQPNGVALDAHGGVYLAGSYKEDISFNTNFSDHSSENLFLAKLHDLDFDVADLRDPSMFVAPGPMCQTVVPLELSSLLIPERSGTGKAVYSSNGIPSSGSNGPGGALGQMPGGVAVFDNSGDQVVIDIGDTIPVGQKVIIRWRSTGGTATMNVQGSIAGNSGFTDHGNITTGSTLMVLSAVVATAPMRFIKLTRGTGVICEVDGIFYNFGSATDGTWSGDGISGNQFNPAGLSGNVDITYTSYGHFTTHTVAVSPVSTAGTLSGGGMICPGSDAPLLLTGSVGASIVWQTSTNGGTTWTSNPSGLTVDTLNGVIQATSVLVQVTSGICPMATSNIVNILPLDTTAPVLSGCPGDITVNTDPLECGAAVSYTAPTGTDNCAPLVSVANSDASQVSGSMFPPGTTAVEFRSTDPSGNTGTCSFNITVIDDEAPAFTCPSDTVIPTEAGSCGAHLNYTLPAATDPCDGPVSVLVTDNTQASGSFFPAGTSTVQLHATDAAGNNSTCSFSVTVIDEQAPEFTAPADTVLANNAGNCGATLNYTLPSAIDACDGTLAVQVVDNGQVPGSSFPTGTTTVILRATDGAGNSTEHSFTVTVNDEDAPTMTCPTDISTSVEAGDCGAHVLYALPTALDNCTATVVVVNSDGAQISGSHFPVGTTNVQLEAGDASGNTGTCSFTITVIDDEAPSFTCPSDTVIPTEAGSCGAHLNYTLPAATDPCDGPVSVLVTDNTQASGSLFPAGTSTVQLLATDAAGNNSTCSFSVTVIDEQAPEFTAPADTVLANNAGNCGATLNYTLPSAIDACDGTLAVQVEDNGQVPGSSFPTGTTTVLLRATDTAGNSTEHSFTVTVNDEEAPLIICPSDISITSEADICGAHVPYAIPTATDNCSTAVAVVNSDATQAPDSLFPIGTTTIQLEASDGSSNIGTCSFSITIIDAFPPTFTAPLADTLYMDVNGQAPMPDLYAQLIDLSDCSGMGPHDQEPPSGSILNADTTATLHLSDAVGNDTTITVQIILLDTIRPTISCPDTVHGTVTPGQCGVVLNIPSPLYTDNSGTAHLDSTGTIFSGEEFPAGTYTVQYTVVDPSGLTAGCAATVFVVAPVLVLSYPVGTICSSADPISPLEPANGGTFSASPAGLTVDATTGAITPMASAPGIYTVYTVFAGPCPDTASTTIGIEAQLSAGTNTSIAICSSGTPVDLFTLLGNGAETGGAWSAGNGTYDPASDSPGTFTYTVPGGATCADAQASITVTETLAMNAGADNSITLCGNGSSLDLSTLLSAADPGGSWSNGSGQYDPITDDPGTIMYIVSGSGQCPSDTAFINVLEQTPPNAGADASITICSSGDPVNLFNLLGNGADNGGTWSTGNGTYDPASDSPGTFTYTVPGGATCADAQASITVTETLAMNAGADNSITLCGNGAALDLSTLLSGADPGGNWSNGNGQYDPITDDPGTLMYIVSGSGQCPSDTAFINVLEQIPPGAGADASITICSSGDPVNLFNLLGNGADNGGTWSTGNGTYDPASDSPGTFTYTVSGGATCADAQASITVTETLAMNAGADSTITLCGNGASLDLSTMLSGANAGGSWSNGNGQYDPITDDPGTITYIVSGSGQCPSDTAFFTVQEQAPPNAGISADLALCSNGSPVNLFTALGGSPDNGGQWSRSDGSLTDGTFDPATDLADSFTYTVEAIAPCTATSSTIIVTVADAPSAAWTSPSPLCNAAQPLDLGNTVTGESGGTWSGPGITSDGQHFDPSTLAPQGSSGEYTITYTVTIGGCTSAQSGPITVLASPVANAGPDTEECGLEHTLAANLNIGSGTWSAASGITFNDPEAPGTVVHVPGSGTYALGWTVTNGPCSATDSVMITFHLPEELTALDAGPDQEQNISRSAMLNGVADGATELHWSVISGSGNIVAPGQASTGIDGLSVGTNLILLSARVGVCPFVSDTTAITVRDLFIPSGFSPNGDGVNDMFEVTGIDAYPANELTVFNRYGQQVFRAAGYSNNWDGKDRNSKELADGTYFYVLSISAEETYHGQVIIKR